MSVSELQSMLESMGIEMNIEFVDILVKSASSDGNLCLDETEFMNWVYKIQSIREDLCRKTDDKDAPEAEFDEEEDMKNDLRAAFWLVLRILYYGNSLLKSVSSRVFDKDGNGYISLDELKSAMEIMDESITEEQLTEIFRMADSDRDGKICYEGATGIHLIDKKIILLNIPFYFQIS